MSDKKLILKKITEFKNHLSDELTQIDKFDCLCILHSFLEAFDNESDSIRYSLSKEDKKSQTSLGMYSNNRQFIVGLLHLIDLVLNLGHSKQDKSCTIPIFETIFSTDY